MSRLHFTGALVSAVALLGCGTDLGLGAGAKHGHAVALGRLAVATKLNLPLNDRGVLIGTNLESRSEENVGSSGAGGVTRFMPKQECPCVPPTAGSTTPMSGSAAACRSRSPGVVP